MHKIGDTISLFGKTYIAKPESAIDRCLGCEGLFNEDFCKTVGKVFNNECSKLNIIYVPYETPPSRESRISNLKVIIKYEEEKLLRLKKELEQLEMGSD